MAVKTLKLGFMPTRRRFFSREDSIKYKEMTYAGIKKLAPEIGFSDLEWLNGEGLLFDTCDAEKVAAKFIADGVDALFIPHCNFGCEEAVAIAARKIAKPVLLWGPRDEAPASTGERLRDSQCGLFATSKVFQRFGIKFTYLVNSRIDDPVFENGFVNFLRAAEAVRNFKNARIGQVGTRPRDFFSVIVNEGELLEKFGIEVIPTDITKIVRETRSLMNHPTEEVKAAAETMKKRVGFELVSADLPIRMAALKAAVRKWIDAENLSAAAFQCWDALQDEIGLCSCFVQSELTEDGVPVICETDLHGALSSLLLQSCSHFRDATFLADLTIRHPENDNAELLWHCGAFPASLAEGKCMINRHFVLPSHAEGVCNWRLKPGKITVSRFDGVHGKYSLFCGQGKTVEGPFNQATYVYLEVPDWPKWEEKIIYGPYIHHVACMYGSYSAALYEASRHIDGLEFDPVDPGLDEIRDGLRKGVL